MLWKKAQHHSSACWHCVVWAHSLWVQLFTQQWTTAAENNMAETSVLTISNSPDAAPYFSTRWAFQEHSASSVAPKLKFSFNKKAKYEDACSSSSVSFHVVSLAASVPCLSFSAQMLWSKKMMMMNCLNDPQGCEDGGWGRGCSASALIGFALFTVSSHGVISPQAIISF